MALKVKKRGGLEGNARRTINPKWTEAPVRATLGATQALELAVGLHEMVASEDCYFLQGDSTVTAVEATSHLLPSGVVRAISVTRKSGDDQDDYVAVVGSSGGTISISRI